MTPHIARSVLWETSGHLDKYAGNMYPPMQTETGDYYVKPMNCPFHVLIYKSQTRSYRDLPMRLSELGTFYRHERIGTLHGLLRIRGRDDGRRAHHLHPGPARRGDPAGVRVHAARSTRTFGFTEPVVELSTLPGDTIVTPEMAERATGALRDALEQSGLEYRVAEGEGSFYGPKVDFHFRDAIGRLWQLTTVQCDFGLPERFEHGVRGRGQRAAPPGDDPSGDPRLARAVQRRADRALRRRVPALALARAGPPGPGRATGTSSTRASSPRGCATAGLRPEVDESGETVGKKVRAAQLAKAPYVLVIGDKEIESGELTVRDREGTETKGVPIDAFVAALVEEAETRRLTQSRFGD